MKKTPTFFSIGVSFLILTMFVPQAFADYHGECTNWRDFIAFEDCKREMDSKTFGECRKLELLQDRAGDILTKMLDTKLALQDEGKYNGQFEEGIEKLMDILYVSSILHMLDCTDMQITSKSSLIPAYLDAFAKAKEIINGQDDEYPEWKLGNVEHYSNHHLKIWWN